MSRRHARIAAAFALLVGLIVGYRWWMNPERQIRAILNDVAAAFTHETPGSGLDALTDVAALQRHLADDVWVETADAVRISGRQEVITAAARVRARSRMRRLRFFDPRIDFANDASATVAVTAEVRTRDGSGDDLVDVHQVLAMLEKPEDRWLVSSVRTLRDGEPQS